MIQFIWDRWCGPLTLKNAIRGLLGISGVAGVFYDSPVLMRLFHSVLALVGIQDMLYGLYDTQ